MMNNSSETFDSLETPPPHVDYYTMIIPLILTMAVIIVIVVLGLIGNGLIIGAVLRYKSMRSAPNILIVNMAVGDILYLLTHTIVQFLVLIVSIDGQKTLSNLVICKMGYSLPALSTGVSIFTMTALSIDRVLVISQTLKLRHKTSTRITVIIVSVWILAITIALPEAISYTLMPSSNDTESYVCERAIPSWMSESSYLKLIYMTHVAVFFCIPLIIITVCYGIMARILVKSARGIPGESADSIARRVTQLKERRKVAIIVITMVALFVICWLPYHCLQLYTVYHVDWKMTTSNYHFGFVFECFMIASGGVNPIALYFLSKSFKTHFKTQLCCRRNVS